MTVTINGTTGIDKVQPGVVTSSSLASGQTLAVNGIAFPSGQVASSDANTLDDYEEGTFTPAIDFNGGTTGIVYAARNGKYIKVGGLVNAYFYIALSNKGSSTGYINFSGLPFASTSGPYCVASVWTQNSTGLSGTLIGYVAPSNSSVGLVFLGTGVQTFYSNSNANNNTEYMVNITYNAS